MSLFLNSRKKSLQLSYSMKSVLFIINPHSGVDRLKSIEKAIDEHLDKTLFSYKIAHTAYAKHGIELAQQGVKDDFDLIVAVGGDGSVNDVLHGIYGSDVTLGIIPMGSGNGLARSLDIPLSPAKAIALINQWHIHPIDVGQADGHLFLSNAGVGFDTLVTEKFSHSEHRGLTAYTSIVIKNFWTYTPKTWQVTIDGKTTETEAFMLTAANAKQLGYGFQIAPKAELCDGLFDLVLVKKFPALMGGIISIRAFLGAITESAYISTHKAKEITITHPDLKALQVDGETFTCNSSITIKMMPKQLKVLAV